MNLKCVAEETIEIETTQLPIALLYSGEGFEDVFVVNNIAYSLKYVMFSNKKSVRLFLQEKENQENKTTLYCDEIPDIELDEMKLFVTHLNPVNINLPRIPQTTNEYILYNGTLLEVTGYNLKNRLYEVMARPSRDIDLFKEWDFSI